MIKLPIPPRKEREANPEFVEILKVAKQLLWDGVSPNHDMHNIFICYAITARYDSSDPTVDALLQDIALSLDGSFVYGAWVSGQLGSENWKMFARRHDVRPPLQAARHRWINQLIKEYGGTP